VADVLDGLASRYGHPTWQRVHDPTSELVLTILSQNSADVNAEQAFESLRARFPRRAGGLNDGATGVGEVHDADPGAPKRNPVAPERDPGAPKRNRPGWGGEGLDAAAPPDWDAVELAALDEVVEAIRPGGLAQQKAPRIQAALSALREARGDHSLEFLAAMPALEARAWLTAIPGIGRKTASVVLLFSFGTPLMPVDRHVERVSKRIGLVGERASADDAHEAFLAMLEPDQMYEAHVNLITHGRSVCHARRPACGDCPVARRCRFVDRRAP
jgi:endonuclease-3